MEALLILLLAWLKPLLVLLVYVVLLIPLLFLLLLLTVTAGLASYIRLFIRRNRSLHRKIAVFGKSGSGKTMLLTTFYGHQQTAKFRKAKGFWLTARDTTQGQSLLGAYYRLENDFAPPGTRFQYTTYDFDVRVKDIQPSVGLVTWYDYPGGWWTENQEDDEQRRKVELMSRLVRSDIALFLVDGQAFQRQGVNYLRCLFAQFRDELARQRSSVLPHLREKLHRFPSIWVICLSKADLFHGYSAEEFRKEILKHVEDDIRCLADELRAMVKRPELVSIGEEFLLLSSAEFDSESQHVKDPTKTIGIDLILAISLLAPIRHAARLAQVRRGRAAGLKRQLMATQSLTTGWMKYLPWIGNTIAALDDILNKKMQELGGLEVEIGEKGSVLESVVCDLTRRLKSDDVQRVYVGVDTQRV